MAAATERGFLRQAWDLAWPYWKSEEKWSAIGLLVAVVALNLFAVWLNVRLNAWNNDFYNALQQYNWGEFWRQFGVFGIIAFALIVDAVYSLYLRQILHIRWRRWLTEHFLRNWLEDQKYYRMQLNQAVTDNPDQRISDDLDSFATMSLGLSLGLLSAFVTLVSFLSILWVLSGALVIPLGGGASFSIPGYMVFAALIYAVGGTFLTRWIGYPLVQLGFNQQRYEADFRFSLVRLRENAENVAFYGGESRELDTFRTRFARIIENWWGIIRRRKKLTWFTTGYGQLAIMFPFIVAAPRYFDKVIQLGGLMQIASAFGQVQDSLSFIITSYTEIAQYQAVVQRLSGFRDRMDEIAAQRRGVQPIGIERGGGGVEVETLDLDLPDGRRCVKIWRWLRAPAIRCWSPARPGPARAHCCARSPVCGRSGAVISGSPMATRCSCRSGLIYRSAPWPTRSLIRVPPSSCRASVSSTRCARSGYRSWSSASMRRETGRSAFRSASSSGSLSPGCCWRVRKSSFSTRQPRLSTRRQRCRFTGCCATHPGIRRSSASAITALCGAFTTR